MANLPEAKMSSVRAVERAIDILQGFAFDKPSMSVVELQKRVRLSRPTLYRLLHTLVAKGLVRAEGDPQQFMLAHGVMQLAHVWMSSLDATKIAQPIIERLRDETNETAALFALREDVRVCVLEAPSRHVLSISRGIGEIGHLTKGASGKVILASMDEIKAAEIFRGLPKDGAASALREELVRARAEGFAISRGEVFAGAVAVAAPFFDQTGAVAGSVGLFGPSARVTKGGVTQFARLVAEAAREISRQLGRPGAGKAETPALPDAEAPPPHSTRRKASGQSPAA